MTRSTSCTWCSAASCRPPSSSQARVRKTTCPVPPGAVLEGLWPCSCFADKPLPPAAAELKGKAESLKVVSYCREGRISGCLLLSVEYMGFARCGAVNNSENELLTKEHHDRWAEPAAPEQGCPPSTAARAVCSLCSVLPLRDSQQFFGSRRVAQGVHGGIWSHCGTEGFMCRYPIFGVWDSTSQCARFQSVIDHGLTLDNLFNPSGVMKELYKCPHHSQE